MNEFFCEKKVESFTFFSWKKFISSFHITGFMSSSSIASSSSSSSGEDSSSSAKRSELSREIKNLEERINFLKVQGNNGDESIEKADDDCDVIINGEDSKHSIESHMACHNLFILFAIVCRYFFN